MARTGVYAADGVDVKLGDLFSTFSAQICRSTYSCSPFADVIDLSSGRFRGPRGLVLKNLPEGSIYTIGADGVGTKTILSIAAGHPEWAAYDLIAMTAMDIIRAGGLPIALSNIVDVKSLGDGPDSLTYEFCMRAIEGLGEVARENGLIILNGETAELGLCVGSENPAAILCLNWGSVMYGVYHPQKMIYGNTLAPGQVIIALRERGFRSNGVSSVRKALAIQYGPEWYKNPDALPDIQAAAVPSVQYDRFLSHMHGWTRIGGNQLEPMVKMHLIVHLSGGAFESKLGDDMLKPQGLSAKFTNLFSPPEIMQKCAKWRGFSSQECYNTWHGGQGALVVVDERNADFFLVQAAKNGVEAQAAGEIQKKQEGYTVSIDSKFDGSVVEF